MASKGKKRAHFADDIGYGDESEEEEQPLPQDGTAAIIDTVLQEDDKVKSRQKAQKQGGGKKGMAVEEWEAAEEEGGIVLPSRIKETRQKRRKARTEDETELLADSDVHKVEEDLEVAEEDGIELMPFNLAEERATGRFDEFGHYIETGNKDDVQDAWLDSEEGKQVSEEVRRQVAEREAAMDAAEAAPAMSTVQISQLKAVISEVLEEGETVTQGLKRLGGLSGSQRRPSKRSNAKPPGAAQQPAATPQEQAAAKANFNRLTEAASQLMDAGELDVYSLKQRVFEDSIFDLTTQRSCVPTQADFAKAAALFGPKAKSAPSADADMFGDDDDDMFAASDDEGKTAKTSGSKAVAGNASAGGVNGAAVTAATAGDDARPAAEAAAAAGSGASPPSSGADTNRDASGAATPHTHFASWPIKELQRFLRERGMDPSGIVEKDELVSKAEKAATAGPEGEPAMPEGYVHDPTSGYYYSSASQMYYDASTGGFCSHDGKWYAWSADTQQFVPWPDGSSE